MCFHLQCMFEVCLNAIKEKQLIELLSENLLKFKALFQQKQNWKGKNVWLEVYSSHKSCMSFLKTYWGTGKTAPHCSTQLSIQKLAEIFHRQHSNILILTLTSTSPQWNSWRDAQMILRQNTEKKHLINKNLKRNSRFSEILYSYKSGYSTQNLHIPKEIIYSN